MPRLRFSLAVTFCFLLGAVGIATLRAADMAPRPNFIVILIDDMGQTDLGCYGSKFYETPHIDKLAAEGMRFTNGYSACTVCSPTRAAVITGKYPARLHITDWIAGHQRPKAKLSVPDWTKHLPLEEVSLAEVMSQQAYVCASMGKWHLGPEGFWPKEQGFDVNIGGNFKGQPPSYFYPYERQGIPLPGLEKGTEGEYLTDRLTDEALTWIEAHRDKPFLLYLPHYAVHTPLQAKEDLIAHYEAKVDPNDPQKNATYAAMVHSTDESVGRIMKKLEELKLEQNTVVIFTSDNGGLIGPTSNLNLRAGKGSAYEGGVKVPFIVRYPPQIKAGSENATPVISCDILPTLEAWAGVTTLRPQVDGRNIIPLVTGEGEFEARPLYWHYPHYHPGGATPYGAIRLGDYRLVEFYETGKMELYDLKNDPTEREDLAASHPEVKDRLAQMLATWRKEVGAQMPTENPNYDPADDQPKKQPKKQTLKK